MKISYSLAKDRASPHCISWTYRKKRFRKYFRTRIDAFSFRNQKEFELGVKDREAIENEVIFLVLSEIKDKLTSLEERIFRMEESFLDQQESMREIRKPPAPKILKITEAAKVLRISRRKLYYLLDKKVFKKYKLPHTRTTFIKLDEVEKALGSSNIDDLLR
jgi:predicted DNA-binding transcriptional regulator AlpA